MAIKVLDQELVQQIAAGEVVEDPGSVIKELVENSIDANAAKIFIELEDGGKSLIRVSDDGVGMNPKDAILATKRHATSKITSMDDLFNIHSLGFRGEALASISSVSQFELITKTEEEEEGIRIKIEGGGKEAIDKVAATKGTTIIAKDLFFNTPARRKHLRNSSAELSKVIDIITRYAVSNPLIYFRVDHNGKTILNSPNTASLLNNIVDIYGKDIAKELLEVDYDDQEYGIRGFISKPVISRADKNNVSVFVNRRYVKNKVITDAIYDAYHTLMHENRYPFAVLMISVDSHMLDVNIHPAKTKIKIEKESRLYEIIFDVVRKTLQGNNLIPNSDTSHNIKVPKQTTFSSEKTSSVLEKDDAATENYPEMSQENTVIKEPVRKYAVEETKQESLNDISKKASEATFSRGDVDEIKLKSKEEIEAGTEKTIDNNAQNEDSSRMPEKHGIKFFVLGQLYKTYILAETKEGLMLIDQHAAHERIIYERLMNDYTENNTIKKQSLLKPINIDLNPKDKAVIEQKKNIISDLGFDFEEFGSGSYVLRTIPVVIGKQQEKSILLDVLDDLISFNKTKSIDSVKEKILSTVACRSAIKAGDSLTIDRMNSLIDELFSCDFGSSCPHGRPTVINITIEELEKRFKRTGF
ncbi:MAG: DNA mismatch repair endonuclease MutL [Candidatus Woesearchaeota archaeon]